MYLGTLSRVDTGLQLTDVQVILLCKGAQPAGQSGGEIELLLSSSNLKEALFLNKKSVACSRWFSESNTF